MARYENETFTSRTIVIDGHQFINCVFETCTIEFRATALPQLNGCHFAGCRWSFTGPAADTIRFMTALYSNGDPVLQNVVDQTLKNVKTNVHPVLSQEEQRPTLLPQE